MTPVESMHARLGVPLPGALADWEDQVQGWVDEYVASHPSAELSEIDLGFALFLFDHIAERVTLAYAVSVPQLQARDRSRMRGFPNVDSIVQATLGHRAFLADRGHFLGHASGGELDINLFPHRRELNRGWSPEGKLFRRMERYAADHRGCFFFHRPIYDDKTWIPDRLEFGVLRADGTWWRHEFGNKDPHAGG